MPAATLTTVWEDFEVPAHARGGQVTKPDGTIDWVVLRPEFRQLLADLALGVIDGVIFYDLDRLVRQPRDLEDLIDIVEYVKRPGAEYPVLPVDWSLAEIVRGGRWWPS
ncbi:recombinase family protein [Streptomyces sp. NPDC004296]|uniref:recombinase family protein n=1 Tax=Streptomyces sp. NPDC004296 TaxID=3364697 RepID=UPI00367FB88D